jgi:Luciferase
MSSATTFAVDGCWTPFGWATPTSVSHRRTRGSASFRVAADTVAYMGRGERIIEIITSWPGITTEIGRFAETEFYLDGRTLGHVHGDHQADIPYPRRIRDELVAAGRTGPHHIHPDSTWTTRYIASDDDLDEVVRLVRINYDRVTRSRSARFARSSASAGE